MHGVSDPFVQRAFETFNIPPYVPVLEQQKPDPEFPTVKFPNPEEKGKAPLQSSCTLIEKTSLPGALVGPSIYEGSEKLRL